jgi:ribosomal protein S18 acetylase RimI-like enzyme
MRFAEGDLKDVVVKLADSAEEALAASHILHRAYAKRGLIVPHPSGLRVTPHGVLPSTLTFVAKMGDLYVGTLSLICDGALGLPLDAIYAREVDRFRARGERLAEVGSLAILPNFRKKGIACLLYRLMYETACERGIERALAAVHPNAEDIYRATLLFERFGEERAYPGLNRSARAVALDLDLRGIEPRFRDAFGHLPQTTENPHYVYITSDRPELRRGARLEPEAHLEMVKPLVAARRDVFQSLPWEVRADLRSVLPSVRLTMPDASEIAASAGTPDAAWPSAALARLVPA